VKGVILAGGTGSRLLPLTRYTNKHLLPVGRYPMICYPIERLKQAGISQIMVVTSRNYIGQVIELLGSGAEWGIKFTYQVQEEAGGIAAALLLAEEFAAGERLTVILGDNLFEADLRPYLEKFLQQPSGMKILLKEVDDPQGYGIAELQDGKVIGIEEKPQFPKSRLCVTGIYFYDSQVFSIIKQLKPSGRGELEITDVNRAYLQQGNLTHEILDGWWIDAGTFHSLELAHQYTKNLTLNLW
jgi:glucose-1-phosphate thymidylyltransferase